MKKNTGTTTSDIMVLRVKVFCNLQKLNFSEDEWLKLEQRLYFFIVEL